MTAASKNQSVNSLKAIGAWTHRIRQSGAQLNRQVGRALETHLSAWMATA
ncbi:MAG: hypothetical protein M1600_07280 [Firmicutes bacterium]|nr:hypothetical protein [Bacillota bacterium]